MSYTASGMPSAAIPFPNGRAANGTSTSHPTSPPSSPAAPTPTLAVSVSPTISSNLHSRLHQRQHSITPQSTDIVLQPRVLRPFATGDLRLLLLENISKEAIKTFEQQGFQVDHHTKAWSEEELLQKIGQYHAVGIRSKTRITAKVLKAATKVSLLISYTISLHRAPRTWFSGPLFCMC